MVEKWYAWLLWFLGAAGGVPGMIHAIAWIRDRIPRVDVTIEECSYYPPGEYAGNIVLIRAVIRLEHVRGPAVEISRVCWDGADDQSHDEEDMLDKVVIYRLQDASIERINATFHLDPGSVSVREDGTIRGIITVEGSRRYRKRVKCEARRISER